MSLEQGNFDEDKFIRLEITPEQLKFLRDNGCKKTDYIYIPVFQKAGIIKEVEEFVSVTKWPDYEDIIHKLNEIPLSESIKYLRELNHTLRENETK